VSRIAARFADCRARGEGALVAYLMAGDPDAARGLAALRAVAAGGADVIELGVPFSDPMADGRTIELAAIRALGAVVGLGMGIFVSVNWAWATDLVSPQEAGKYLGLANLATAGPSALSRLMGPLVDVVNGWRANAGYRMLFTSGAAAAALALYLTLRVPETRGPYAGRPAARPA